MKTLTIDTSTAAFAATAVEAAPVEPTGPTNYFRTESGATMSIHAAVTIGLIYRGTEPGTIFTNNRAIPASSAVLAGIIDEEASQYIAGLAGTNVPAPFTREDYTAVVDTEEVAADAAMASMGAFFAGLPAESKAAALEALTKHLAPVKTESNDDVAQ